MAMSMNDIYYGTSEPTWLVNHSLHVPSSYNPRQQVQQQQQMMPRYTSYTHHGVPLLEIFVPMCCSKCEEKVRDELLELRGVENVMIDQQLQKVIVTGFVDPLRALKKLKKVKKEAEMWSSAAAVSSSAARYSGYAGSSSGGDQKRDQHHVAHTSSYNLYTPSYGAGQCSYYYPVPLSRPS
ncbi:hypothetical protein CY35_18G083500 [Sphagnum magellanicum]|jgi:copper chaperone CopZ|nr:hypothetical protein CY35_18G083500 [Sphagnum magellanicum]